MPTSGVFLSAAMAALLAASSAIAAQAPADPPAPQFAPIAPIAFETSGPVIHAHTEALKPFTVAGERGVLVGQQDGTFEAWVLPVKILSHLTIEADIEGYTVPIDVNQQSAEIEVRPDRTVITYSHIGFTVRQIMFSPGHGPAGTGPVVLYQFDCLHPTDFTFRFTPNLEYMWPERNEGHPSPEWVAPGPNAYERAGGYYVLHADYPDLAAAITIPDARPGILAPYQERPQVHPVELKLHIDPARDRGRLYPLLMAVGTNKEEANTRTFGDTLEKLNQGIASEYAAHADSYKSLLANSVSIDTPDKALNQAFQWAEISIEQLKAKPFVPDPAKDPQAAAETALVAGYYASGDSARPGFGWFFGRDALYTLYAVNGYGDFPLAKSELEFLIHRQRADGKIMHEYSQTAPALDWQQFPYMYAAADSTPLFILAMLDYVRASGDVDFLKQHRDAVEKAWAFETDPAHDTDHDGIYDNSQGTGWVESWPGGMPHQEIYLAELGQQASTAYAALQTLLGNEAESRKADARAHDISAKIEQEYYDPQKGCYAFATNPAGTPNSPVDRTTTVYPALAWWSGFHPQPLAHGGECLQQLAEASLDTDWGLRDVSNKEPIYDGMSYHQGSVWPLFTGWAAMAEYRGNQPLAGYRMLMQNANLTWAQDLGADTELLSGDFFVPFGRSTTHQLWSSAMVITPTLRGLFGISIDAQTKTITANPQLPANWNAASIRNLQLPTGSAALTFRRVGSSIEVQLVSSSDKEWHLRSDLPGTQAGSQHDTPISANLRFAAGSGLRIHVPEVEIDQTLASLPSAGSGQDDDEITSTLPDRAPIPGARTARFRIIQADYGDHKLTLTAEGLAGTRAVVGLIRHGQVIPKVRTEAQGDVKIQVPDEGGSSASAPLVFHFPEGTGWKTITVTLNW